MTLKYTPFELDTPIFKIIPPLSSNSNYIYLRIFQPGGGRPHSSWDAPTTPVNLEYTSLLSTPSIIHAFAKQGVLQPKLIEYDPTNYNYIASTHMLTSLNNMGYTTIPKTTKIQPLGYLAPWLTRHPELTMSQLTSFKMPAINLRKFLVPLDYSPYQLNKLIKQVQKDILLYKI